MKRLSLRLRLTLFIVLLLTGICVLLTLFSLYNANHVFVVPYMSYTVNAAALAEVAVEAPAAEVSPYASLDGENFSDESIATTITQSSAYFNDASLLVMLAVISGGGLLTYFLLGRALKPLHSLSDEISAVTENELSQRIGGFDAKDEISSLADSFNMMLGRIDKAFSDQKRFSSDAAHELKTPLAAIKTNIDVLRLEENPTSAQYEQTLKVVDKQTQRMVRLVDDLFTMSSQRDYDFNDTVEFDELFADVIGQLAPRIAEKKLSVHFEKSGFKTTANSVMLTRAFSNLVENAVKYNIEGGSIDISACEDAKNYRFTIRDTGIGIPKEKQEHIFKPFYRVDDSRSRKAGGAGLGLAIVKDVVERHGGTISVSQAKDGGAEFTVILPKIHIL